MNPSKPMAVFASDTVNDLYRTLTSSQDRIAAVPELVTKNAKRTVKEKLVQFNITHAGMALGCSAYSAFLRTSAMFNLIPSMVATIMWTIAVVVAIFVYSVLILRSVKYPHLARHDLEDSYRTPFFVTPAIVASGLTASSPPIIRSNIAIRAAFLALLAYQCVFALFWYGRWLFYPSHTLRRVRATYLMATTEFFLLGYLGALAGFDELGRLALSVGMLFWGIVLVTFFQFLGKSLGGRKPQPTMFLLIAPPAGTAIAHMQLQASAGRRVMDDLTLFYCGVTLFLYCLLIRLFRQYWTNSFSASWWAYIFPLSTAANLSIRVANEIRTLAIWIIAGIAATIAHFMIFVVTGLSIWAAWNGNLPSDETALRLQSEKENPSSCLSTDESDLSKPENFDVESQIRILIHRMNQLEESSKINIHSTN